MTAQGGYGLTLTMNGTTVVGVSESDYPAFMKYIEESTAHDSAGGYYEATATGKRRVEPIQATLFWDKDEATHASVVTAFDADTSQQFTIADPDSDETIEFNAHVERIRRMGEQETVYQAEVDIHPTGTATIT